MKHTYSPEIRRHLFLDRTRRRAIAAFDLVAMGLVVVLTVVGALVVLNGLASGRWPL